VDRAHTDSLTNKASAWREEQPPTNAQGQRRLRRGFSHFALAQPPMNVDEKEEVIVNQYEPTIVKGKGKKSGSKIASSINSASSDTPSKDTSLTDNVRCQLTFSLLIHH